MANTERSSTRFESDEPALLGSVSLRRLRRRLGQSLDAALASFLVLSSLGVAWGLWSKSLTIDSTVHTGNVHAQWVGVGCFEFHTWPQLPRRPEDLGELEGKDVGNTIAVIDEEDPQILHITIENGYPSYAVDCEVHYVNNGSIPVIIRGTTIKPISLNLTNCSLTGNQTKTFRCDQLTAVFADGIGLQLDPNDEVASSLRIHVEQLADQNATYELDVLICLAQWNEDIGAGECFAAAATPTPAPTP